MGLLDDLKKKGTIAENITSPMNGVLSTYNIDCKKYNTCIISVINANDNSVPFKLLLKDNPVNVVLKKNYVACLNTKMNHPADDLSALNNTVTYFAVDVSAISFISIDKNESGAVSFYYVLTNDTSGRDYVNLFYADTKIKNFDLALTTTSNSAKCNFANTTTVYITNQKSFSIRHIDDFTRWW